MGKNMPETGTSFQYDLPVTITKAFDKDKQPIVYMIVSTSGLDRQGEVVLPEALIKAASGYIANGVISYNHRHHQDPGALIGKPLSVYLDSMRRTVVKGHLLVNMPAAKSVWDVLNSEIPGFRPYGASIGGRVLQKASNVIKEIEWDDTAITPTPVNQETIGNVSITPFEKAFYSFMKQNPIDNEIDAFLCDSRYIEVFEKSTTTSNPLTADMIICSYAQTCYPYVKTDIMKKKIKTRMDVRKALLENNVLPIIVDEVTQIISEKIAIDIGKTF